jgi:hypothetical protein
LVVVHGDGRVITRCVAFDEDQISGSALLERSGLAKLTSIGPLGQTICSLDGEGCPSTACFCECISTPCIYWVYHNRQPDGSWGYANIGAAQRMLADGDVDAWVWGEATQSPPPVSFETICGGPAVAGGATVTPAATPTAEAAATTSEPTPTAAPPTQPPPSSTVTITPDATLEPTETVAPAVEEEEIAVSSPTVQSTTILEPTPEDSPSVSSPDVTVSPLLTPVRSPTVQDGDTGENVSSGGGRSQLLGFVVVFGVVVAAFLLLSRRSGA